MLLPVPFSLVSSHGLFALALSPLLIKIWRMYKIMKSSRNFRRKRITHAQAAMYTLPIILIEIVILAVFNFVDPPRVEEYLEVEEGYVTSHRRCDRESQAYLAVQFGYYGLLVLVGCYLAYITRNLDPMFGETKQLCMTMYHIAFFGCLITIIVEAILERESARVGVQAVGIAWTTMFSSVVFVLPRLIQIRDRSSNRNMSSQFPACPSRMSSRMSADTPGRRASWLSRDEMGRTNHSGDGSIKFPIYEEAKEQSLSREEPDQETPS